MYKAVKVLNLFSIIIFSGILLLVYAYLPIRVDMQIDWIEPVSKQHFFYYTLTLFILTNLILRVILEFGTRGMTESLLGWIYLLIFVFNFYLTVLIGYLGVLNNAAHFAPNAYGYLTWIGPTMMVIWIMGVVFLLFRKD